jgi:hypothetical protein
MLKLISEFPQQMQIHTPAPAHGPTVSPPADYGAQVNSSFDDSSMTARREP